MIGNVSLTIPGTPTKTLGSASVAGTAFVAFRPMTAAFHFASGGGAVLSRDSRRGKHRADAEEDRDEDEHDRRPE